jgi:hypothetical protein
MRILALGLAAAALALSAPLTISAAQAPDRMQLAQADVTVKKVTRTGGVRKKVVVRHRGDSVRRKVVIRRGDQGLHRGWRHSRHYGATRSKTVIKHRGNKTIVKKKIEG